MNTTDGLNITIDYRMVLKGFTVPYALVEDDIIKMYYTKIRDIPRGINVYLAYSDDGISFEGETLIMEMLMRPVS